MPSQPTPDGGSSHQQVLNAIARAVQSSNISYASQLADQALARGIQHPTVFNARALWFQERGRFEDALAEYQRARVYLPRDVTLLHAIGLCLISLNRLKEAVATFDEAIAIDPNLAQTHYFRGWALGTLREDDAAQSAYERAIVLRPDYPEALASLASIAANKEDATTARSYAERALKLDPVQPTALSALAALDLAGGAFVTAEMRLRPLLSQDRLSGRAKGVVLGLLGDSLDGQRRFPEAFEAYLAENDQLRRWHRPLFQRSQNAFEVVDRVGNYFEGEASQQWRAPDDNLTATGSAAQHVFLAGFMRSGTTLLEQILACSPAVVTLDERELLAEATRDFFSNENGLDRLATLDTEKASYLRNLYWSKVQELGLEVTGRVFVDKQPLHTIKLPLIAKLFPKAKIVFAAPRSPRCCFQLLSSPFRNRCDHVRDAHARWGGEILRCNYATGRHLSGKVVSRST